MDAADFKTYIIFPLLFFERICDVWESHRFQIPDDCHWNDVRVVLRAGDLTYGMVSLTGSFGHLPALAVSSTVASSAEGDTGLSGISCPTCPTPYPSF